MSRSLEIIEDFATSSEGRGSAWDELLRAAERGDDVETRVLAVRLAHTFSRLRRSSSHEVLAGGPHATAKAIELAEALSEGAAVLSAKRAAVP